MHGETDPQRPNSEAGAGPGSSMPRTVVVRSQSGQKRHKNAKKTPWIRRLRAPAGNFYPKP